MTEKIITDISINIVEKSWPLANEFRISRGVRTSTEVLEISLSQGSYTGHSEAVPYPHYGESLESVASQILSMQELLKTGISNQQLIHEMPSGAARNAIDCALWDLRAKIDNCAVHEMLHFKHFSGAVTAQTLSINTPELMAGEAAKLKNCPLIKVKLDGQHSIERMTAIALAAPDSHFIIDANEAWDFEQLKAYAEQLAQLNVVLIEQPLPADSDNDLIGYQCPVPICADESIHTTAEVEDVALKYQFINIKLDKSGGLTEGINLMNLARQHSLGVMVGCMVGTSLSMAPASLIASYADFIDLDGPSLLAKDVAHGFSFLNGRISALDSRLWGGARTL